MKPMYNKWSRRIERNILACYHRANDHDRSEGLFWYVKAQEDCQAISNRWEIPLDHVIGVVSALSPGNSWGRNLIDAELFISEWSKGHRGHKLPTVGVYGFRNRVKSIRILSGEFPMEVLGGQKVRAFYQLIASPGDCGLVCIDRHAKCIAYDTRSNRDIGGIVKIREFGYLAWHYQRLADRLGLLPHQLQATCWVTWRRLQGQLEQQDLPF